jgi:hypothetical protein
MLSALISCISFSSLYKVGSSISVDYSKPRDGLFVFQVKSYNEKFNIRTNIHIIIAFMRKASHAIPFEPEISNYWS